MFRRGVRLGARRHCLGVSKVLQNRRGQPAQPRAVATRRPPAPPPRPASAPAKPALERRPRRGRRPHGRGRRGRRRARGDGSRASAATRARTPAPAAPSGDSICRVRPARPDGAAATAKRAPAAPASARRSGAGAAKSWVEASGSVCPPSHPVKAKLDAASLPPPGHGRLRPHRARPLLPRRASGARPTASCPPSVSRLVNADRVHPDDAGSARAARRAPRRPTGSSVASTMRAASPCGERPTSMSEMFTRAAPSTVPTTPITPGRSSLRTTSMWRAGGTSIGVVVEHHDARLASKTRQRAGDRVARRRGA